MKNKVKRKWRSILGLNENSETIFIKVPMISMLFSTEKVSLL